MVCGRLRGLAVCGHLLRRHRQHPLPDEEQSGRRIRRQGACRHLRCPLQRHLLSDRGGWRPAQGRAGEDQHQDRRDQAVDVRLLQRLHTPVPQRIGVSRQAVFLRQCGWRRHRLSAQHLAGEPGCRRVQAGVYRSEQCAGLCRSLPAGHLRGHPRDVRLQGSAGRQQRDHGCRHRQEQRRPADLLRPGKGFYPDRGFRQPVQLPRLSLRRQHLRRQHLGYG